VQDISGYFQEKKKSFCVRNYKMMCEKELQISSGVDTNQNALAAHSATKV
jgi:hypothetical protein